MDGDFSGDHSASNETRVSGNKRRFGDHEHDVSVSKKSCTECVAIVSSTIESLEVLKDELASCRALLSGSFDKLKDELASLFVDSFQSVKDEFASCQNELDKWKSAFKKESFVPARKSLEPQHVIDYIQTLRSSDKSLKEELEIAQMKLAIRDLKSQLKPASMKTDEYPEVDSEHQGSTPAGPSLGEIPKDDEQEEPDIESLKTIIEDQFRMIQTQNSHFQTQSSHIETLNSQIQTQNSLFQRFDAFFDYLAAKDPHLAALRSTNLNPKNDQAGTGNDQAGKNDSNTV